jgi:hypothetical protein
MTNKSDLEQLEGILNQFDEETITSVLTDQGYDFTTNEQIGIEYVPLFAGLRSRGGKSWTLSTEDTVTGTCGDSGTKKRSLLMPLVNIA